MKKLLSVLLCGAMILAMASCSSSGSGSSSGRSDAESGSKIDSDVTVTPAADPAEDPASGPEEVTAAANGDFEPEFVFEITDRDGNVWNEQSLSSNKLTMINFWEPWCGPCVNEIPDLARLYENYKDKGFEILGVYNEKDMENEVDGILSDGKVTYPILHYTAEFDRFQTGFVPTTVFVDSTGHIITMPDGTDSVIGSNTYEAWEAIINYYL